MTRPRAMIAALTLAAVGLIGSLFYWRRGV